MTLEEIIQQLWYCLEKGYTYDEAKIHIEAVKIGKTTAKEVVVKVKQ
jgi:hypothetical protein